MNELHGLSVVAAKEVNGLRSSGSSYLPGGSKLTWLSNLAVL
jgi:hypothetical protein